jgi:hypothetical protein
MQIIFSSHRPVFKFCGSLPQDFRFNSLHIDSAHDAVYCYCACQETPPLLFNLNRRNTFGVRPDWSS